MKKISEIIKPFLSIIFGALLLLIYVNWLSSDDSGTLFLGIFGVILSVYYLTYGIMDIIIGDKLPKKIFNIFTISLYPIFMFIMRPVINQSLTPLISSVIFITGLIWINTGTRPANSLKVWPSIF